MKKSIYLEKEIFCNKKCIKVLISFKNKSLTDPRCLNGSITGVKVF